MKGGDLAMKKVLIVLMIFALCFSNIAVFADNTVAFNSPDSIIPYNIAISFADADISINALGSAWCFGKTIVSPAYSAGTTVELQQNNGGWHKFKSWSATGASTAVVDKSYYVDKGYSYRLKVTHKAYDSNGKTVETIVKYSNVVKY